RIRPCPIDIIEEDLVIANVKSAGNLTESERVAVEYKIRGYIKRGGIDRMSKKDIPLGFRKKLADEDKEE
ncbi:unnamed protein product, partial [marine sediment metagenome]